MEATFASPAKCAERRCSSHASTSRQVPDDAAGREVEAGRELTPFLYLEDCAVSQGHNQPKLMPSDHSRQTRQHSGRASVRLRSIIIIVTPAGRHEDWDAVWCLRHACSPSLLEGRQDRELDELTPAMRSTDGIFGADALTSGA